FRCAWTAARASRPWRSRSRFRIRPACFWPRHRRHSVGSDLRYRGCGGLGYAAPRFRSIRNSLLSPATPLPKPSSIKARALVALACLVVAGTPASAIVGGARFAEEAIARHVVLIVGAQHLCSGVAIAPDLVLTAAHCVPSTGKYRLMTFDGRRPAVK